MATAVGWSDNDDRNGWNFGVFYDEDDDNDKAGARDYVEAFL